MVKKDGSRRKKMSDIARLAGVSESTVSRALAGSTLINEETRKRIQTIAEEQNYSINRQARNLRTQSSQTVSVIFPIDHDPSQHVSDPFFLELLGAIADALTESDYDLLLSRVHTSDWRRKVNSQSYTDGLVIIGQSTIHEDINDFAKNAQIPLVVWGAKLNEQAYVSVGSDNSEGGRLATQHLLGIGCRRIVFLGDPDLPEAGQRFAGYRRALLESGVEYDDKMVYSCRFSPQSGEKALAKLFSDGVAFDGIFATSDVLASLALAYVQARGFNTPNDIAIVGYDDITIARHTTPALTTVSQRIRTSGFALVDNLFRQMRGEATRSEMITPKLVARGSSLRD